MTTKVEELGVAYWEAAAAYWAVADSDATFAAKVAAWTVVERAYTAYKAELDKPEEMNYETD